MWRFVRGGLSWPVIVVLSVFLVLFASGQGVLAYDRALFRESVERARERLGDPLPPLAVCPQTSTRCYGHLIVVASVVPGALGGFLWLVTAVVRSAGSGGARRSTPPTS